GGRAGRAPGVAGGRGVGGVGRPGVRQLADRAPALERGGDPEEAAREVAVAGAREQQHRQQRQQRLAGGPGQERPQEELSHGATIRTATPLRQASGWIFLAPDGDPSRFPILPAGRGGGRKVTKVRGGETEYNPRSMASTAGIVLIGNELLSGKVVDANAAYLCRQFRELGVEVRKISVIPDEVELIAREVREFGAAY